MSTLTDPELSEVINRISSENRLLILRTVGLSDYFRSMVLRYQDEIVAMTESGFLHRSSLANDYSEMMESVSLQNLDSDMRRLRHIQMCRIILRDLNRLASLEETVSDLSNLADAVLQRALSLIYEKHVERYGVPRAPDGTQQWMSVLALGKLGARELNLSSDIDLMFIYEQSGEVDGGKKSQSNQEFFLRVSRELINAINNSTAEGFVFRVDMRLRPYGESGALITHRGALEKYYLEQGRDWERYAFIKARVVAGDLTRGQDFLDWLNPFIYRKHLDFGAIEALRDMKRLINREVASRGLESDLKLGPGGIREVEFIVQVHQLIFAGTRKTLQDTSLLRVLEKLGSDNYLPQTDVDQLTAAYYFLRCSEHAIQAENDRQTQQLPQSELSRSRLAEAMGFVHWEAYMARLDDHRVNVSRCFANVVTDSDEDMEAVLEGNLTWQKIWSSPDADVAGELLGQSSFAKPEAVQADLLSLLQEITKSQSFEITTERLNRLMPLVLQLCAIEVHPDATLERLLSIVESIIRRTTYVAFLLENIDALKRLVSLCAMSPWVAEKITAHPILLYELTDRATDNFNLDLNVLRQQLDDLLKDVDSADLEEQMDILRQFKIATVLKVAIYELLDLLPVMRASDALTGLAELVLDKAVAVAWFHLLERHGYPLGIDGEACDPGFAIVAYGKFGGIELGYSSDLDLVFIHAGDARTSTSGPREVNTNTFFNRMGQRIVHILSSLTRFGRLYEVDMRLRPQGNKGPLVTTVAAYEQYQQKEAWTWEHQALVRARVVAGDRSLGRQIEHIREEILERERDREQLRTDVVAMREKMRYHLDTGQDSRTKGGLEPIGGDKVLVSGFDLKHGLGAIVDIEFVVQYAVLGWASSHAGLARWSDKMRIIDELVKTGLFQHSEGQVLQEAYLAYRAAVHYQSLGGEMSSFEELQGYRQQVMAIWDKYLGQTSATSGKPR